MALKLKATASPPKSVEPVVVPGGELAEILHTLRKDKGEKTIVRGDQISVVRRLPTGIFELDFAIGGGFPCGRYSIVYGPESSGKTNVALKATVTAQHLPPPCNKVIWVNVEQSFDPLWATRLGVNVTDLLVVEAGYGEEAVDIVDALVRADDVALIVVDSMAGLIASKEIANSVEKADVMSSALLIKRMVNKLMIAFCEERKRDHDPCVILINQTRFKPTMFGDPEVMPGGEAQKFLSSLRVRLYGKNVVDTATNTLMFKDIKAVIKKAKVPVRAVSFEFQLCVHAHDDLNVGDTNSFGMVRSHLQALGLFVKDTKGYVLKVLTGVGKGGIYFSTLAAANEQYQGDNVLRARMQQLVLDNYKDVPQVFVDETDYAPAVVEPGVVQPIAPEESV